MTKHLGLAALYLGLAASAAHAEPRAASVDLLARAQSAVDEVDFEAARTLVVRAIAEGGMSAGELARAARFAGEVTAALGDDAAAQKYFLQWILLDPNAALAPDVSPKIAAVFEQARDEIERVGAFSLAAKAERGAGAIRVTVGGNDPLQMVASLRIGRRGHADRTVRGRSAELEAADTAPVMLSITALDRFGNALWSDEVHSEPPVVEVRRGYPGWARWPTWTAVAIASGAAGGYFAWQTGQDKTALEALHAESSMHSYDEALTIRERGDRNALFANIAFGVAGASAIAAVVTYVLEPGGVELRPMPAAGGAGVTAAVRF